MEPNDLNSRSSDEVPLDTWLRANATLPPLPDNGFSRRVLTSLPAPARRSLASPRLRVILLGTVAGLALVAFKFFTAAPVDLSLPAISPEATAALTQLADPKLPVALGVTAVTLAFAFWRNLLRRVGL